MSNSDMPAMPSNPINTITNSTSGEQLYYTHDWAEQGLTKREHFAGLALQGYCNNGGYGRFEDMAIDCLKAADALLTALETKS